MRSGLVQTGAWAAATTAAVVLSWLGVSTVLSDAAFEAPGALPLPHGTLAPAASASGAGADPQPETTSAAPSTAASPTPSPSPSAASPSASRAAAPATSRHTAPAGSSAPAGQGQPSTVHSYLVPGGRVALDEHPDRAELVSATPDAGWQMQIWNGDQWLRIDFSKDGAANSVFVTWNGHPPDVQTVVR
ncbi:hypothetical protein [Kitasatospora azatica]|uniref:hypothetical protein n=1 Tax=Kitasatospora azatica TaxID=58347 RepID=UPI0005629574|nr:hypothetical protein [Kitasatospora azatica]